MTTTLSTNSFLEAFHAMYPAESKRYESRKKPESAWAAKQQEKFVRCPLCGGTMTRPKFSNVLMCENLVKDSEGNAIIDEVTGAAKVCGFYRELDEQGQGFARFIFGE